MKKGGNFIIDIFVIILFSVFIYQEVFNKPIIKNRINCDEITNVKMEGV